MKFRENRKLSFCLFMGAALALRYVPGIGQVLKYFETFFHEMSHGLASVLTGGTAHTLVIRPDGSGHILVGGGFDSLVAFAGYAGAALWGCLIYGAASGFRPGGARLFAMVLFALCLFAELRWVSWADPFTMATVAMIGGCMLILANRRFTAFARPGLRLVGANVAITALATPTYLLRGATGHSDAQTVSDHLILPEWFWVGAWIAGGGLWMFLTWRAECKADLEPTPVRSPDPLARMR